MNVYFYARNDNWARNQSKGSLVNLRNAMVFADARLRKNALSKAYFDGTLIFVTFQPLKAKGTKKYISLYPKGALFVARPPTSTGMER